MSSVEIHKFPVVEEPHLVTIKDKTRNSGLTSVNFVDDTRMICADFNDKLIYLTVLKNGALEIINTHPTVISDGSCVQTDLIDFQDNLIVVSNFYQGSVGIYRLTDNEISFEQELDLNNYKGLHGVRFIPGHPGLLWLAYCGAKNKCHQIVDWQSKTVIHQIDTDQQCQDIAFINGYAVVFARTDHIKVGTASARILSKQWWMFATAYVYKVPEDLRLTEPVFISRWKGKGHLDACKAYDGEIYAANQYLDRVDVFSLSDDGRLSLSRSIEGMGMPHGLDVRNNKLAVTNYGDQTLRIMDLAAHGKWLGGESDFDRADA